MRTPVGLAAEDAAQLSALLCTLEDWLLHTDELVLHDLADFAFGGSYNRTAALTTLIDDLGWFAVRLRALPMKGTR